MGKNPEMLPVFPTTRAGTEDTHPGSVAGVSSHVLGCAAVQGKYVISRAGHVVLQPQTTFQR